MPDRILNRHVGGNTTYAREIRGGLLEQGHEIGLIPSGRHPALTALTETTFGLRRREPGEVVHYTSDTGPMLPTRAPSVTTVHGVASR